MLMEELKDLEQQTLAWKKPKAGDLCSHMHMECRDGKFVCLGCSQEVTDADKIKREREQEIEQKLGEENRSEPEESVERGDLQPVQGHHRRGHAQLRHPVDERVAVSRQRVEGDAEGRAVTFISHCFSGFFGDLIAALCDGGADLTRRVWLDIFAVRQWPSSKSDSLREVTHMSAADSLGHRFPAAAKARVPFFRVWCLFEIFYAAIEGKPIVMKGGSFRLEEGSEGGLPAIPFISDPDMLMSMYFAIDVEQADAKEGVTGFNGTVRGVLTGAMCAACGDANAMVAIRERAEVYFPIAAARGFRAVLAGTI
eukprot:gene34706-44886_t